MPRAPRVPWNIDPKVIDLIEAKKIKIERDPFGHFVGYSDKKQNFYHNSKEVIKALRPDRPKEESAEITKLIPNLDDFETFTYNRAITYGSKPLHALEVMVNTVEGDTSQLSPALKAFAHKKGWLKGWETN